MKAILMMGKGLAALFWLSLLGALAGVLAKPFDQLLSLLALVLILVHGLELWLFSGAFAGRANPWLDRLQVLFFGVFHLALLKPGLQPDAQQQSAAQNEAEAAHA
jgi:putative membrane protein